MSVIRYMCFHLLALGGCAEGPVASESGGETGAAIEEIESSISPSEKITVPSGFYVLSSGTGVTVYQKDYSPGYPDYVVVVNLKDASVRHLTGPVASGAAGTSAAYVTKYNQSDWWTTASGYATAAKPLMTVVNGTFFANTSSATSVIAYGVKSAGTTQSTGYNWGTYAGKEQVLKLDSSNKRVAISTVSSWPSSATEPDIIGALDPTTAYASASAYIGRTFAGLRDDDGDGNAEYMLLFSSTYATQSGASSVLASFGASDAVMLDGGGSSFFRYRTAVGGYATPVSSTRKVPDVIAVYGGR